MRIVLVFIFCFLFVVTAKAQEIATPVVAYSKIDKTQATTGDTIQYEISIDYDKRIKPEIPDIKTYLNDFSIVEETKQPEKNIDNRLVKTFIYKVQAKEPGAYIIQPVVIKYNIPQNLKNKFLKGNSTKTSKIYIDIKSVLKPEDRNQDIDDIKDIEDIKVYDTKKIGLYLLGFLLLAGVLFAIYKFLKRIRKPLLPHELAFKEIQLLKKEGINSKMLKPSYFKLSEILRTYLEKKYNIPILSMTLNQIKENNHKMVDLSVEKKDFINDFIEKTDFYKYSDNTGSYEECLSMIDSLYNFVDSTKPIKEKSKENRDKTNAK